MADDRLPIARPRITTLMKLALEAGAATLATARELGISGVPIDGRALLRDGVTATLKPLLAEGLNPCQVGAFFFNPLHPDTTALEADRAELDRLIPLAAEAGCPWIALPGGSCCEDVFGGSDVRNLQAEALEAAARILTPLARAAEREGVRLTLEPHLRSALAEPERAAHLCERIGSPALRITFDVSNFYGFFDLLDSRSMTDRCARALVRCCGLVHLKEVALAPGFHLHAGLVRMGAGHTDWCAVLQAAASIAPADTWILIEHCASADEARASVALVRDAARKIGLRLE